MTNMEHVAQPRPGSHADKLWNRNSHEEDPDPLYSPASVPVHVVPIRAQKRSLCRPMQPVKYSLSPSCEAFPHVFIPYTLTNNCLLFSRV